MTKPQLDIELILKQQAEAARSRFVARPPQITRVPEPMDMETLYE